MNSLPKSNPVNFQVIDDGFGSSDDGGENYQYFEEAVWQKLQVDETILELLPMFEKIPNLSPEIQPPQEFLAQDDSINLFYITDDEYILDNLINTENQNCLNRSRAGSLDQSAASFSISNTPLANYIGNINFEPIECVVVNAAHLEQFPKAVSPYSATLPCIFSWFNAHTAFSSEFPTTVQNYFKVTYSSLKQHLRFFFSIAPSQERLNNLSSVRREISSGRILFHYIGYGFPDIGKKNIWCSERRSREFVPFKLETLFQNLHPPTWYIFDCNNAAVVIKEFKETAEKLTNLQKSNTQTDQSNSAQPQNQQQKGITQNDMYANNDFMIDWTDWICICASSADEELPDDPRLPHDFLTSTLLTPLKMAAICHMLQYYRLNLVNPTFPLEPPCSYLWDEKTPESAKLSQALSAITDGIAADSLSPELYYKLFKSDTIVLSLFRHFLLAQYLLRPYRVHPVSYPEIPDLSTHPLWKQWTILLDTAICTVSIPRPTFNIDLFTRASTTFEVLMKNGQYDLIRPYHISLLFHSILDDQSNDQPIVLLAEYAKDQRSSPLIMALTSVFPPLFVRILSTNPSSPVFYPLCYLILYLLYYNPSFSNEIPKEADASQFPAIPFNRDLPENSRIAAAALVANLVVCHEVFQQICTSNDYLDKVRSELSFKGNKPNLCVWLLLSIRRAFNLYSPDPAVFTENALHLQCALCTCSNSQSERAAAISALTCFLRPFECKCNLQILFMSLFSAIKDVSYLVRFHLVLLLKKFVMSFDSFSEAVNSVTTLCFDNYHSLINSIYNCTVSNIRAPATKDEQSKDETKKDEKEEFVDIKDNISVFKKIDSLMKDEKVTQKAYAVSIALLQMLSSDPHPSVSSLSQTVLQFVAKQRNAFESSMNEFPAENNFGDESIVNVGSNDSVGMYLNNSVSSINTDQNIISYGDDEFEAEHLSFAKLDQNESLNQIMLRNLINPYLIKSSKNSSDVLIQPFSADTSQFVSFQLSSDPIVFVDFDDKTSYFAAATKNTVYCMNLNSPKDVNKFEITDTNIVSLHITSFPFVNTPIPSNDQKLLKNGVDLRPSISLLAQASSKNLIVPPSASLVRKVVISFTTENGCVYTYSPPKKHPGVVYRADPHTETSGKLFAFFVNKPKCHTSLCAGLITTTRCGIISRLCLGTQKVSSEYATRMNIVSASFAQNTNVSDFDYKLLLVNNKNQCFLYEVKNEEFRSEIIYDNEETSIFKAVLCRDNGDAFIALNDGTIIVRKSGGKEIEKLLNVDDTLCDFSVSEDGNVIAVCLENAKPRIYVSSNDYKYKCNEITQIEKAASCIVHNGNKEISFIFGDQNGSVFLFSHDYGKK